MKVTPLYDRVIIETLDPEKEGTIIVPDVARRNSPLGFGRVLAVGDGAPLAYAPTPRPMRVAVGDFVLYSRPSAQPIPWDDRPDGSVVVTNEANILGVCTEVATDTGLTDASGSPILRSV